MNRSEDRYALAATLEFGARQARLQHGPVRPRWSADSRWMWFEQRHGDGIRHRLVDVLSRTQGALFDAPLLTQALALATGQAPALPLRRLEFDAQTQTVAFDAEGARWRWHCTDAALLRTGAAFADHDVVAPDGSAAVRLQGHDIALVTAGAGGAPALATLTDDGVADHGWGDFTDFVSQLQPVLSGKPRAASVLWSPDSQRFAVLRVDRRAVPLAHLLQSAPPGSLRALPHSVRYPTPRDAASGQAALWIFERDGRRTAARLHALECRGFTAIALGWVRWAADSRSLLLAEGSRDARRLALWQVDAGSGEASLRHEEHGPALVFPSPSMAEPAVMESLGDGSLLWWSQRSGWGHLERIHPDGRVQPLTSGPWQVRQLMHVDAAAGRLLFTAGGLEAGCDPTLSALYAMGLDGDGLRRLTPGPGQHALLAPAFPGDRSASVAPDGAHFIDNHSSVRLRPHSDLCRRDGHVGLRLTDAAADGAWPARLPLPEPFAWQPPDGGEALWGVLYRPADFDPAERYPVVEVVYAGPQTIAAPKGWDSNRHGNMAEQMAALGCVAVVIDGRGTPYRSRDFQAAVHGRIEMCGDLPSHVQVLRVLAARRPWMDLGRVGIVGGSGGGYATVRAMADFPDFYRAGAALCGNHDQGAYTAMWGEWYHGLYDPDLYAAQANTSVAHRVRGPLLLVTGDVDDNVHPSQTLRLADALLQAGARFELMVVPNAGHTVFLHPQVQRRVWRFIVEQLVGEAGT